MILEKEIQSISGVYKITNVVNGKCYIGSSYNCRGRYGQHLTSLRKNKNHNKSLQEDFNKYGEENFKFEVIKYTPNYGELEFDMISKVDEKDRYNIVGHSKAHSKPYRNSFVTVQEHNSTIRDYQNQVRMLKEEIENLRKERYKEQEQARRDQLEISEKVSDMWKESYDKLVDDFIQERHQLWAEIRELKAGILIPNRKDNVIYLPQEQPKKETLLDKLVNMW